MNGFALVLAASTLGIDVGWQPTDDGRLEYIIQIEPELLEAFKNGELEITSDIDPGVDRVHAFRVIVGNDLLPRIALPASNTPEPRIEIREVDPATRKSNGLEGGRLRGTPAQDLRPARPHDG